MWPADVPRRIMPLQTGRAEDSLFGAAGVGQATRERSGTEGSSLYSLVSSNCVAWPRFALAGGRRFTPISLMAPASPVVSIVIATYNAGLLLQGCIDSLLSQEPGIAELLVIDGGSTDATLDVIRRNSAAIAHWQSSPDAGIADAWNKGLDRVRGRWVLFMGADDRFADPDVLARFNPVLAASSDRLAVFGKVLLRGGPWDGYMLGEPWRWKKFRLRMTIPHQGAFHSRRLFQAYGRFDTTMKMAADYELLLRPGPALDPLFVDDVVSEMGGTGASISSPRLTFREARDAQLRLRVAPAALIHSFHLYTSARSMLQRLRVRA